ncbi:MAG: hypothetical protein ACRDS9_23315 [Pseudonocardiaceae bacterium]
MTTGDTFLPSPDVAAAAVVELASANQPRGADEGLDLLRAIGVYDGTLRPIEDGSSRVAVEASGPWRGTDSGLVIDPGGAVTHFWSHLWFGNSPEVLLANFDATAVAIATAIGSPDEEDRRDDGSRSVLWRRQPVAIEFYLHAERPRAGAVAQIGISWADGTHPK